MSFDPRSRIGVTIDGSFRSSPAHHLHATQLPFLTKPVPSGRKYTRKPSMYIDISHIPTISAAVEEASRQLRRGIMYAMSSCPEGEAEEAAAAAAAAEATAVTVAANTPQPTAVQAASTPKRPRSSEAQPPLVRDASAVYAAILQQRAPVTKDGAPTGKSSSSTTPVSSKATAKKPDGAKTDGNRNNVRKTGPKSVPKRPLAADEAHVSPFQPAPKRRDKSVTSTKTSTGDAPASLAGGEATEKNGTGSETGTKNVTTDTNNSSESKIAVKDVQEDAQKTTAKATGSKPSNVGKTSSKDAAAVAKNAARKDSTTGNEIKGNKATESDLAKALSSIKSGMGVTAGSAKTGGILKTVGSATAGNAGASKTTGADLKTRTIGGMVRKSSVPAAWSQMGLASGGTRLGSTGALAMLRRNRPNSSVMGGVSKPGRGRGESVRESLANRGTTGSGGVGNGVAALPSHLVRGNSSTETDSKPAPSTSGQHVQYVPRAETIDGVRPNGYTVGRDGKVRPVVTFNPQPKLPHKLRQTSLEKLFEGWRDFRKEKEADALATALRTEQEIYASASGRVDYRAAVTVKLKELRSAAGSR